jgi:hypothetical protein
LACLPTLLKHRAEKGYRSMRFLRFVYKKKAINEICEIVAPKNKVTVVGFGDWSGGKGTPISRRCAGPLQEIKLELNKRNNVVMRSIHEMKTSITCNHCLQKLTNKYVKNNITQVDGSTKVVKYKVHKILHCKNSQNGSFHCGMTWNRDDNASRNILMLLMFEIRGWVRPAVFCTQKC